MPAKKPAKQTTAKRAKPRAYDEPKSKPLTKTAIEEMYAIWQKNDPAPTTELDYHSDFTLLVSVVLSAQATDVSVNKATAKLWPVADTPTTVLALGEEKLSGYIRTIGLYRSKAKNVIGLCEQLLKDHSGHVPNNQKALEALPGVGRKTANVVRNTLFGAHTIAVDTHVFRVGNRTGLAPGKTPLEVEKGLLKRTPEKYLKDAHHWLILHGRYTCLARKPKCGTCTVRHLCTFPAKGQ